MRRSRADDRPRIMRRAEPAAGPSAAGLVTGGGVSGTAGRADTKNESRFPGRHPGRSRMPARIFSGWSAVAGGSAVSAIGSALLYLEARGLRARCSTDSSTCAPANPSRPGSANACNWPRARQFVVSDARPVGSRYRDGCWKMLAGRQRPAPARADAAAEPQAQGLRRQARPAAGLPGAGNRYRHPGFPGCAAGRRPSLSVAG
jgi:hypothetical protein